MVRPCRITVDDVFQPLGDIVLAFIGLVSIALIISASALACVFDWLQERRFLGPATFGVMVAVVLLQLVGCASAPAPTRTGDPRDPEVWRPTAPAVYPLPR